MCSKLIVLCHCVYCTVAALYHITSRTYIYIVLSLPDEESVTLKNLPKTFQKSFREQFLCFARIWKKLESTGLWSRLQIVQTIKFECIWNSLGPFLQPLQEFHVKITLWTFYQDRICIFNMHRILYSCSCSKYVNSLGNPPNQCHLNFNTIFLGKRGGDLTFMLCVIGAEPQHLIYTHRVLMNTNLSEVRICVLCPSLIFRLV